METKWKILKYWNSKHGSIETKYLRMDHVNLWKTALKKFEGIWSRVPYGPYPFKFYKGCLPQILLGPFVNSLSQLFLIQFKLYAHNMLVLCWNRFTVFFKTIVDFGLVKSHENQQPIRSIFTFQMVILGFIFD